MNILCFLAVAFLVGCIEGQDDACCFLFPSNGQFCEVRLSDDQLCQSNPCPSDEYCKVVRGRTSCCTQEFRRLATAFGSDQTFCRERCLAPPRNSPFPRLPVCPCPSVRPCCPATPHPPLKSTPAPQAPPKTPEPQAPPTPQPQSPTIPPNGDCWFMFNIRNLVCKVHLLFLEQCTLSPCPKGEYCRMRRGRALCCKQEFRTLATAFGQDRSFCAERCLGPPRQTPSNPSNICIRGSQPPEPNTPKPLVETQKPQPTNPPQMECKPKPKPKPKPESQPPLGRPQDDQCHFLFKSQNQDCKVSLSPQEKCMFSPCPKGQYCKMRRGRDLCCTQQFRSLSTAFGQNSVFCRESCLIPPRRRPLSTSNVCLKGMLPPPKPTDIPQASTPDTTTFLSPKKFKILPNGDCCIMFMVKFLNKTVFKVKIVLSGAERCMFSPCPKGQYCRMRKGSAVCCKQQDDCTEICLAPPQQMPSNPSDICIKGPEPNTPKPLVETQKPQPTNPLQTATSPSPTNSTESPAPGCPTPSDPANGAVTVNNDIATYSCDYGYTLRPNKVRVCRNGAFKGKTPKCAPLRECTEEGKCRLCLKGAQLCDKSGCDSSQYCRVKKGKKYCCRYQERKRDGKCKQRCNLLR